MLAKVLKINQIFIPIFIIVLWLTGILLINQVDFNNTNQLLSFCLISIATPSFSLIINNFSYLKKNFFYVFSLLLGTLFFITDLENVNYFAGTFFLFIVILQTLVTGHYGVSFLNDFDLGFLFGFAILLYPPLWVFSVYLILYFILYSKKSTKNFILLLFGFLSFCLLFVEIITVFDLWGIWEFVKDKLHLETVTPNSSFFFLVPLLIPFGVGLFDYSIRLNKQPAIKKIVFSSCLLLLLPSIAYYVLYGSDSTVHLIPVMITLMIYVTNFLTFNNNLKTKEALLWVIVICLGLFKFGHYIEMPEMLNNITF